MSNHLYIEVVEIRPLSKLNAQGEVALIASDSYGTVVDSGYDDLQALVAQYPTRLAVLEYLNGRTEFDGAFSIEGNQVRLDSCTGIRFTDFPEDASYTVVADFDMPVAELDEAKVPVCTVCGGERELSGKNRAMCYFCGVETFLKPA